MSEERLKRGARRDPKAHSAILDATLEVLHELGYGAVTIEGIAARAGVGKTTIYRWWPSKGALIGEALASRLSKGPEPETGDLESDLLRTIEVTLTNYTGPGAEILLLAFAAHLDRDDDLLDSFREDFLEERRRHGRELLERAIARGELRSDADIDLMMDVWAGTVLYRGLIRGAPIDSGFTRRLVRMVLGVVRAPVAEEPGVRALE
jgi:AcrR family transcriptional regulator